MLIKKKLLQIPPQPCPKRKKDKQRNTSHRVLTAAVQVVEGIVVIDMYREKKLVAERFFADGKSWLFYDAEQGTWSRKTNSVYLYDHDIYDCTDIPEEAVRILGGRNWRQDRDALTHYVSDYTTSILSKKRMRAAERKRERIDAIKKESIYEPKGLNKWCLLNVFPACSMILPKNGQRKYIVKCLCCGHEFTRQDVKHKELIKCPRCRRQTMAYLKRYITSVSDKEQIAIFKKIKNGFAAVGHSVHRRFNSEGKQVLTVIPKAIYHFRDGRQTELREKNGWYGFNYERDGLTGEYLLYTPTIKHVFSDGKIEGIHLMKMRYRKIPIFGILESRGEEETKALCRIGCYRLAGELKGCAKGESFSEVTGIDQNYVTVFRRRDYGLHMTKIIKDFTDFYHKKGTYTEEQLSKMEHMSTYNLAAAAAYMSDTKFINYFTKQQALYTHRAFYTITGWYDDYMKGLEFLAKAGADIDMNATITRYPKDIGKAHDIVMKQQKMIKDRQKDQWIRERAEKYDSMIKLNDRRFLIRHPVSREDFITEGTALKHCVGQSPQYYENQARGTYMTFFIRKKEAPDKPYYTATFTLENGSPALRECHGLGNKVPTKEIEEFLRKYLEKVKTVLTVGERSTAWAI